MRVSLPLPGLGAAERLGVKLLPLSPFFDHRSGIDEAQRNFIESRFDLAVSWHEVPLEKDSLSLLAYLEFIPKQCCIRMRRPAGNADAVRARNRRRYDEPVDRCAFVLELLGLVVVCRQGQRDFTRSHQIGEQS